MKTPILFGKRLRQERQKRHLTQEALAEAIGISPKSISRWEQGQALPQGHARIHLCSFFHLQPDDLFAELDEHPSSYTIWNVPYPQNPFFTGRAEILHSLHEMFSQKHAMTLTQSLTINGLGGIGKTQIALEYAYRYRQNYRFIFWTSAATQEALQAGIATIADLLHLPERNDHNQSKVLQAVRQWLATNREWLWILDNADDIVMMHDIFPDECPGHLLLTSRAQAWGTLAQCLEIETLGLAEGTLLLLRRAGLLAHNADLDMVDEKTLATAEAIVLAMDFLPLALDQAGAYIDEVGCSLSAYLELYQTHRKELLQRRGDVPTHHPESVATTWSLSFERIELANPATADLLRLCAFLEPDTIPEEMISAASAHFSPVLQQTAADTFLLNEAMKELRRFSLVQRNSETQTLRIHRLVQIVLKDSLQAEAQRTWAVRAVRATNTVFPQEVEVTFLPQYRRYLSQVQGCSTLIQEYALAFDDASSLLFRAACYLQKADALYEQAEPLFKQALQIQEQRTDSLHFNVTLILNSLANLYMIQGKYTQAEPLFYRALHIQNLHVEADPTNTAQVLNDLGELYIRQTNYTQAEPLLQQALQIWEEHLGPDSFHVAQALNNLTFLAREQGNYEQAEPLIQRALQIWEKQLGPDHPDVAFGLKNLAVIFEKQGNYEQAEPLFLRALQIREQTLSPTHLSVASSLMGLANLYRKQGKNELAEQFYERALCIRESRLIAQHPDIAETLQGLASLRAAQGRIPEALSLYKRASAIQEQVFGTEHSLTTTTRMNYAALLQAIPDDSDH